MADPLHSVELRLNMTPAGCTEMLAELAKTTLPGHPRILQVDLELTPKDEAELIAELRASLVGR